MNASHPSKDAKHRYLPSHADAKPAPGYDAWIADELANGLADLDTGKTTPLADLRKEFGLE